MSRVRTQSANKVQKMIRACHNETARYLKPGEKLTYRDMHECVIEKWADAAAARNSRQINPTRAEGDRIGRQIRRYTGRR